jgi:hypothetical protein
LATWLQLDLAWKDGFGSAIKQTPRNLRKERPADVQRGLRGNLLEERLYLSHGARATPDGSDDQPGGAMDSEPKRLGGQPRRGIVAEKQAIAALIQPSSSRWMIGPASRTVNAGSLAAMKPPLHVAQDLRALEIWPMRIEKPS